METNKISFSFSKTTKKPNVIVSQKPLEENKVELIDCLEGQSIKIKNAVEKKETPQLVIPVRHDARSLLDRIKAIRSKQKDNNTNAENSTEDEEKPASDLSLDELAARELLKDAKNWEESKTSTVSKVHELPLVDEKLVLEGAEEATMEDYEKVPINDFGLAVLRGMGWKEGTGIGKTAKLVPMEQPECRPKGLGLGATKLVTNKQKKAVDEHGNELILKVNACAKIIAGNHQGEYGQVQSMDDENALVFLKTAIKGEILKLNDVFLVPVTKEEYSMCSRVLNNKKYEKYKALSDKNLERQRQEINSENDPNNVKHSEKYSKDSKKLPNNKSAERPPSHEKPHGGRKRGTQHRSSSDDSDADNRKPTTASGRRSADCSSSSKTNQGGSSNSRRVSSSESGNDSRERKESSSGSRYQHDKKKGNSSRRYTSSEDSDDHTDTSASNRSRSQSKRSHGRNKMNNRSSSSSSSEDYRSRSSKSTHEKSNQSSSSSKSKGKHKKHKKKSRCRSESSGNESGYENANKRRRNKTKCRHRRYSNEESEEHYKKNKKNKR